MAETLSLPQDAARSEWVRLRTLIMLRWLAILGQTVATVMSALWLGLELQVGLCALAIGASVILNLAATFMLPENRRLSQRETTLTPLFDLGQLVFLLYLNGGLNNPFALLILAPVTISATALRINAWLLVAGAGLVSITFLAVFCIPLHTVEGEVLELPPVYILGHRVALVIGILFLSVYARRVTSETFAMSQALSATQMTLAREHEPTLPGGVAAAAAHETGTPLATIKLVASELAQDLPEGSDMRDDAVLIGEQAARLREILRDMGQAGKEDLHLKIGPITGVVQEAAKPHENRGKDIVFMVNKSCVLPPLAEIPHVARNPALIHGLRNLVQNGVDFARTRICIHIIWTDDVVRIIVGDDGHGFPGDLLGRLGDPFLSTRQSLQSDKSRPECEGMGLGLFIAKTLLERSGAEMIFANTAANIKDSKTAQYLSVMPDMTGAIVMLR
ncbi:MAG: ActS/PrrB/RegB family redox-sensitive histidine kinase [Rhodobacteraceae bacterium]|nr:ActS/PrrB/RegB family redox-sensitive histidine kinase [Paracoccaceae bacterium]